MTAAPKPRRTAPHIKMRRLDEVEWWIPFTAELLAFVLSGPTRTWTEINAWGKARQYTDVTIVNMVAFLDLSHKIARLEVADAIPLWGEPPPPIECPACRAEKETGGKVRDLALHTCGRVVQGRSVGMSVTAARAAVDLMQTGRPV